MGDKLYHRSLNEDVDNRYTWISIPDEVWQTILSKFFFKIADSFGFYEVLETKDLFPIGLEFFEDWKIEDNGLIEFNNEIVAKFKLNEVCKKKLLEYDFAVH